MCQNQAQNVPLQTPARPPFGPRTRRLKLADSAGKARAERLHKAINSLARMASGRLGRFPGTYEKFVIKTSCVIVYTKDDRAKTITIVCIIHTSREWLEGTLPE
jgi:plasmid stabilization system protein ParE